MSERPPLKRLVHLRYRRTFPHDLATCYAWLTDYDEDDPRRAGAVLQRRPVLERHEDRVILDATVRILGREGSGRTEVRLSPPDHWEAHILEGNGAGSVYRYHLTPTDRGTRLDVDYGIAVRSTNGWLRVNLARPFALRELGRMWDGYAKALAADAGAGDR